MEKTGEKPQKNVDLVNNLATVISNMDVGDKIAVTPLAKSITLSNEKNPHVHTVVRKLDEAELWKEISPSIKFIRDKKGKLKEIEKLESSNDEILLKKEIRNGIANINSRLDNITKLVEKSTGSKEKKE